MLTLDYRPLTLNDVVGQEHIKPILRAMVKTGKVPAALIFGGTRGTGKTTTVGKLAQKLREHGRSVLVGAGDTFRAAAEEQQAAAAAAAAAVAARR